MRTTNHPRRHDPRPSIRTTTPSPSPHRRTRICNRAGIALRRHLAEAAVSFIVMPARLQVSLLVRWKFYLASMMNLIDVQVEVPCVLDPAFC